MKGIITAFLCVIVVLFVLQAAEATRITTKNPQAKSLKSNPIANPNATVIVNQTIRFTVLTSSIIRMEYAEDGVFEDHASLSFVNRNLPVPSFTSNQAPDGVVTIEVANGLILQYSGQGKQFDDSNLVIKFQFGAPSNTTSVYWNMSTPNPGRLYGTIRTLDGSTGHNNLDCDTFFDSQAHCTYGIISRNGWVVINDSEQPLLDNSDWAWFTTRPAGNRTDYYFFAHGHNYKLALKEFTMLSGDIPLPPRFAFGVWYSRYWAYNDREQMQVVSDFQRYNLPIDVLVTDMDWHLTFYKEANQGQKDQAGQTLGWTGYTWDSNLFPDPAGFLRWCKSKGLKNTVNLHPASGIQPWEQYYPQIATAMGIDPSSQKYVPFVVENKTFVENWWNYILKPIAEQGIDFWWLDWQQGEILWTHDIFLNPTIALNHIFFTNPMQWTDGARPMIFHRWGGLGNHRYQIGFSGDVVPSWSSLAFQPYFTATAANVGYGFWSHDLGGHTDPSPAEIYTRWVQWGALSPIFRTHCTKSGINDRRIWTYPYQYYQVMKEAMELRSILLPYIYTAARASHDTGVSMIRGMYYEYPEAAEAYSDDFRSQYLHGDCLIASPIVSPVDSVTQVANKSIWIPDDQIWIEWFTGKTFTGPQQFLGFYTLDEIPLFVRAGCVIPLLPSNRKLSGNAQAIPESLILNVFTSSLSTGKTVTSSLYDDDGKTTNYLNGEFATTTFTTSRSADNTIQVNFSVQGSFQGMVAARTYELRVHNVLPATTVQMNGQTVPYQACFASDSPRPAVDSFDSSVNQQMFWCYDATIVAVRINLPNVPTSQSVHVVITQPQSTKPKRQHHQYGQADVVNGVVQKFVRVELAKQLLDNEFPMAYQEDYKSLDAAAVLRSNISGIVASGPNSSQVYTALSELDTLLDNAVAEVKALSGLSSNVQAQVLALLQV